MKILVCIKQVNGSGEMSRFDAHALEEALIIKERHGVPGPVFVDVVTAGPADAVKIIRRAFGMGADQGYHFVTKDTGYVSSFVTASRLAKVAEKTDYDLILTGIMSQDMMDGQTGPMLARIMDFPCATGVVKTSPAAGLQTIEVEREMENSFRDCLEIRLPAVLTIQAGINTPRYPRLSQMLAANRKKITSFMEQDLFPDPVPGQESCIRMEPPKKTRSGRVLEGSLSDKAEQLFFFLKEKNLI
ncbi:MAG: electron transfer flavoprotein subunit beta/FixA family protein [Deltaproteobacteria bacterium]|nr:electron transfer flavoprotein subunit beta/FixA family protein [Deltaproteobacteria bacterium]